MLSYTLDGWGRITAVETAEGGREEYAYDCAGNVTESTDANGNIIHYAYNSMGKVCAITDQSGNTETFRYDREGRQTEHTDRNGTVIQTKYNIYGKPVMQTCIDKNGNRQVMGTWEYDSFGQLKKAVAGGFCYTYEYRPDGKLLNKWSSGKKVQSCTYYRDGSLKSMTDVSGKTVYYEYDGDGRLRYLREGTGDGIGTILTEYRYTTAGRIKEIITRNGITTAYSYDEDGNISRLTIGDGTEGGLLYDAFMLYDLNGNRTGKNGTRLEADGRQGKMAVSYRYDCMNRLTNEDRNGTGERYAYDLCGNRLIREQYHNGSVDVTEGYRYNERNELTERVRVGILTTYSYDKNGSIVSEAEEGRKSEYRYDLLNRQTYVKTLDGKEQENSYDGEGLRAGLKENGKRMTFLFHNGEILTECDGDSAPVRRHVRGIGLSHVQTLHDNVYHAYHQDEQGSTAYITGQDRETENTYQYDAFGNLTEKKEGITNRILYTGQQYDQETGQYYLRARYYNPVVGRFLQEDTYRGDGLNLYAYCANNPVVYYDPSGHDPEYQNTGENNPKTTQGNQAGTESSSKPIYDENGKYTGGRSATELNDLANDPAHAGSQRQIDIDKGVHEREVGLGVEESGQVIGPITRDPSGKAEFIDANGQAWDVKSFNSNYKPKQGGYTLQRSMNEIYDSLSKNENVILDTTNLSNEHITELLKEIKDKGLSDQVIVWP